VWQELHAELSPLGLDVVTVALDVEIENARPFVEAAQPTHPSLIDRAHVVDELLGIVNVPMGVWIDEAGTIVRPAECANVTPSIPALVREGKYDPGGSPEELRSIVMQLDYDHELYPSALRDWAANGSASEWVLAPDEVIARSAPRGDAPARAAAHFELGELLHGRGDIEGAQRHWRAAHRLQPENWTYKRQAWHLVAPNSPWPNEVYDGCWVQDVQEQGAENYFPPIRK
jgi:hypothetical protein